MSVRDRPAGLVDYISVPASYSQELTLCSHGFVALSGLLTVVVNINNTMRSYVQAPLDEFIVLGPVGRVKGPSEGWGQDLPSDGEAENVHSIGREVLHLSDAVDAAVLVKWSNRLARIAAAVGDTAEVETSYVY